MDLCILFTYAHISGMPLKSLGEFLCSHVCLVDSSYVQLRVELITLQLVMDMFNYLAPGGITAFFLPSPINLHFPQYTTSV